MSYLIAAAFGTKNIGDEAILAGLINIIGKENIFRVFSSDPQETQKFHAVPAAKKNLPDLLKSKKVLIGGGQLIQDKMVNKYMILAIISKILRKKCSIYAVGASPLSTRLSRILLRFGTSVVDEISVRDELSHANLYKMGIRRNVKIVDDPVFQMSTTSQTSFNHQEGIGTSGKAVVGLDVRLTYDPLENVEILKFFGTYCREILGSSEITFLPFSRHKHSILDNDYITAKKLEGGINNPDFKIVTGTYSPQEYFCIIKSLTMIVSNRLHPILFAVKAGIPVLGVQTGNDQKIVPFAQKYSVPIFTLQQMDHLIEATKNIFINSIRTEPSELVK